MGLIKLIIFLICMKSYIIEKKLMLEPRFGPESSENNPNATELSYPSLFNP